MVLGRLQRGLEALYRISTGVAVDDFVIEAPARDHLDPARRPREQLLLREDADGLAISLFIDPDALANLAAHDPARGLTERNLGDFLLAIEGVSHFIYTVRCAQAARPVSALELELQAEVDKFITCLLVAGPTVAAARGLRQRLFAECVFETDLDVDEASRYRAANDNAERYAAFLGTAYVAEGRIPEMLAELRRFYRQPLARKLAEIAKVA